MHLLFIADNKTARECKNKGFGQSCSVVFMNALPTAYDGVDAVFYLLPEEKLPVDLHALSKFSCLVLVNAVCTTLAGLPTNVVRINGWRGFINRPIVEVSAWANQTIRLRKVLNAIGWKYRLVADLPGFITARIVATIVNEAYWAKGQNVANRADIDTAMQLGTNYPYGPFAWAKTIGKKEIASLLATMALNDKRYQPSFLLLTDSNY